MSDLANGEADTKEALAEGSNENRPKNSLLFAAGVEMRHRALNRHKTRKRSKCPRMMSTVSKTTIRFCWTS